MRARKYLRKLLPCANIRVPTAREYLLRGRKMHLEAHRALAFAICECDLTAVQTALDHFEIDLNGFISSWCILSNDQSLSAPINAYDLTTAMFVSYVGDDNVGYYRGMKIHDKRKRNRALQEL